MLEVQLFFVHAVLSLVADKRTFGRLLFLGDCVAAFQPLRLYSCLDAAEGYHGILPVDFKYFSDRTLSFDTYRTPFGDGSCFGSLLNCRLFFGAVLLFLLLAVLLLFQLLHLSGYLIFLFLGSQVVYRFTEVRQFLAYQTCFFFFSLCLFYGTDGILDTCI